MRMLVIDSATEACSVALFDCTSAGSLTQLAADWRKLGRGHAEALVPMIAALPDRGRADRIAVALGPGSFTGVRVGLAAARALGIAWRAEVSGYSTLSLIAAMARREAGSVPVAVATSGGHGEWFVQRFDADGIALMPLASLPPDAAATAVTEATVAGNRAQNLVAARGSGRALDLLPDAAAFPALGIEALIADLAPLYGRGPDATLPGETRKAAADRAR